MVNYTEEEVIKVPRFKEENGFYTTRQRSLLMSKIKAKDTSPEILLRKALWKTGLRYRLYNKSLPGNPDIVLKKYRLIIFIDGEFWHGFNWEKKREKIKTNRDFWIAKIERNMQRDKTNTIKLELLGFKVLRFWERQIKKEMQACIDEIQKYIDFKKTI
ncbi:very short patch repair endonuclease [Mucilaginibacter arboris]|uniref:Very short patch repair endonuclease n=1 Tax=Mucilaginibacter arboris TaxID=2682090 RepID=A0A7K1T186_9SPHI|nr:very short patch repair endonuclease [Mucilaginibacter arboris]MVN23309.1 DNA mismatch endonuclease Vsr [Mucilaginibacter arboris]